MISVKTNMTGLLKFKQGIQEVKKNAEKELCTAYLEDVGEQFLDLTRSNLRFDKSVISGRLVESLSKGGNENVWEYTKLGKGIKVGTKVYYAGWVNDGHWTIGNDYPVKMIVGGVKARFVPGEWIGDRFVYIPNHKKGMVLKQQWVNGTYYFSDAQSDIGYFASKIACKNMESFIKRCFV